MKQNLLSSITISLRRQSLFYLTDGKSTVCSLSLSESPQSNSYQQLLDSTLQAEQGEGGNKGVLVTGYGDPQGCWHEMAPLLSRQSAHRQRWDFQCYTVSTYIPRKFLVLISVRSSVNPPPSHSVAGRIESTEKNHKMSSAIKPVTFQLVAWCLNWVPQITLMKYATQHAVN
jgi:hypothetical protein